MALVLRPDPSKQFVMVVPPSTAPTTLRLRVWHRPRAGAPRELVTGFQIPDGVRVSQEPVRDFDSRVDTKVAGGEG